MEKTIFKRLRPILLEEAPWLTRLATLSMVVLLLGSIGLYAKGTTTTDVDKSVEPASRTGFSELEAHPVHTYIYYGVQKEDKIDPCLPSSVQGLMPGVPEKSNAYIDWLVDNTTIRGPSACRLVPCFKLNNKQKRFS